MDDLNRLWWGRVQGFWKDAGKYLKIIVTGYVYLPMVFLLVLGWLYKSLLTWLPTDFPIGWVIAGIFALLLNHSPIRTFLKKADVIFLLPVEPKLTVYFLRSFLYSFFIQTLGIVIFLFLLAPMYTIRISSNPSDFYFAMIVMILLKAWNLSMSWYEHKWEDPWLRLGLTILRYLLNMIWGLLLVGQLNREFIWIPLFLTILLGWFMMRYSSKGYPWLRLLELEEQNKSMFYSFAQWFMEIPEMSRKVRNRTVLLPLMRWIPHHPRWAYTYLFIRSIFRYNDLYYGYLRLVLISFLLLVSIQQLYISVTISAIFLFLSTVQLANGWNHLKYHFWYRIYPLPSGYRRVGFSQTVGILLIFQLMVTSVAFFYQYPMGTALGLVVVSIILSLLFINFLLPRIIKDLN
ncbi:MAG TPA: ABC transporter permease [Bacillota bacterium]|nr:ABC transporter permease [Bacillota bacterium]